MPAFVPLNLVELAERDCGVLRGALPNGLAASKADRSLFLGYDLDYELRQALNLRGVWIDAKAHAELLETRATQRKNLLADELAQLLVLDILLYLRQVGRHVTDEDGIGLFAAIFELPSIEGERPEVPIQHNAPRPRTRVLNAGLGKEVAELVPKGAFAETQLEDATPFRAGRPGDLADALPVPRDACRSSRRV